MCPWDAYAAQLDGRRNNSGMPARPLPRSSSIPETLDEGRSKVDFRMQPKEAADAASTEKANNNVKEFDKGMEELLFVRRDGKHAVLRAGDSSWLCREVGLDARALAVEPPPSRTP